MGCKIKGIDELCVLFEKLPGMPQQRMGGTMKVEATEVQTIARAMAPVDTGGLEAAILVERDQTRDSSGRFTSGISYAVYVDQNAVNDKGQSIGEYAYMMHEYLTPFGPLELGPKSLAKNSGQEVGGKYLERAGIARASAILQQLANISISMF